MARLANVCWNSDIAEADILTDWAKGHIVVSRRTSKLIAIDDRGISGNIASNAYMTMVEMIKRDFFCDTDIGR